MQDAEYMRRALDLAERGRGRTSPNPMVGAVLVRDGSVVGEGWHAGVGRPHAEIDALEAAGKLARGATLYVNLEPCAHFGRTPPCAPRIADAGVARVVIGMVDPNPLVDGAGVRILRDAGVQVDGPLLEAASHDLNAGFLKHASTGLPFVTLKMAASLDGKAAARDGSSRWITGKEAREEVHRMRAAADAIMVGAGTALRDDPHLTVRAPVHEAPSKLRVVTDGRGIVPATHQIFDASAPTLVATTDGAPEERRDEWRAAGADVVVLDDAGSRLIPLPGLLRELGKRDVLNLLVEGGPTLAWELVVRGLVDRVVLFLAPILVGGAEAPSVLMGGGVPGIGEALRMEIVDVERVGRDLKVVADVHRDR